MSLIVVQGKTIETKDIYDIEDISSTRTAGFVIKLIDKPNVEISEGIPYETRTGEFKAYYEPYDKLRKAITEQWEADKTELKTFKL